MTIIPKNYRDYKWYHWVGVLFLTFVLIGLMLNFDEKKSSSSSQSNSVTIDPRLPELISQLKGSEDPQKYMDLAICYESMYRLATRTDEWKLNDEEFQQTRVVTNINGSIDGAAKQLIKEYCPNGANEECYSQMPLNLKGYVQGVSAVRENFLSDGPNDLIQGKEPGNSPLVQRKIMVVYCRKFGYPK